VEKNEALEGLRGLACLSVLTSHFFYMAFPFLALARSPLPPAFGAHFSWEVWFSRPPFDLLYNGDFAVIVFFTLSGYVLSRKFWQSGNRVGLVSGALKRYPRLFIPAAASIVLVLILMRSGLMHTQMVINGPFGGWVRDDFVQVPSIRAAFYAAWVGVPFFADPAWNNVLWTLKFELYGSLALFAAFLVFGRYRWLACAALAAWALSTNTAVLYLPFAIGAAFNGAVPWLRRHNLTSGVLFVVGAAIGCVNHLPMFAGANSLMQHINGLLRGDTDVMFLWYTFGAAFMMAGLLGNVALTRAFASRVGAFFGRISFSMYLLHWPIICSLGIWSVSKYMAWGVPFVPAAFAAYASTSLVIIASSVAFCRWVDVPATRFSNRLARWVIDRAKALRHRETGRAPAIS
jgi:peptidoglycan/LPS O-acetylase OafA/YrhL